MKIDAYQNILLKLSKLSKAEKYPDYYFISLSQNFTKNIDTSLNHELLIIWLMYFFLVSGPETAFSKSLEVKNCFHGWLG